MVTGEAEMVRQSLELFALALAGLMLSGAANAQDISGLAAEPVAGIIQEFTIDNSERMTVRSEPVSTMNGTAVLPLT